MHPLVYLVVAFIIGLLTSRAVEPAYSSVIVLLLISIALLTSATIKGGRVRVLLACPAFFVLGLLYLLPSLNLYNSPDNIRNLVKAGTVTLRLEGVVAGAVEARGNGSRFYIEATGVDTGGGWRRVQGRVQVTTGPSRRAFARPRAASRVKGDGVVASLERGDIVRAFVSLKTPKNFGNPGGFDYEWWLRARGVSMTAYLKSGRIVKVREGESSLLRSMDSYRAELSAFIDAAGLRHAGILKALTIGEKGAVPEEVKEVFRRSGTAHLLAISGLHIGFVAFVSYLVVLWLLKRSSRLMLAIDVRRTAVIVSFLPVLFYAAISGFSLSTQRAVIMIGAYVITVAICRVRDLYTTLALAAFIVLLINPASLWDAGFQLSFTAVLAIIYILSQMRTSGGEASGKGRMPYLLRRFFIRCKDFALVTIAASLATAPIMAVYFHRVSMAGFIANLIVVPVATFIVVPLGLLSVLAYSVSKWASLWLMRAADPVIGIVTGLAGFFAQTDWAFSWVATPGPLEIVAYYLVLAALPLFILRKNYRRAGALLALFFACLLVSYGYGKYTDRGPSLLEVTFISVGQGDAALVEFPEGADGRRERMLIDGGGFASSSFDSGKDIIAPFLWKKKIKRIDYLVLSHPQRDHMKGLGFIAEKFSPAEFWWSGKGRLSEGLASTLKINKVKVRELGAGSPAFETGGVRIEFLNPPQSFVPVTGPPTGLDVNDSSLVMRLVYGKRAFLFTGDIGEAGEEALMRGNDKEGLRADILKAPHHGSRYSSAAVFLELVRPEAAIISLGRGNSFGFPHKETLIRYKEQKADIFRTDRAGAVVVTSNGEGLDVRSYLTD